jgi:hypothetical protein
MMRIQFFNRIANSTMIWKFAKSISSIREFTFNKVRVILSDFIFCPITRNVIAIFRAINTFFSPIQGQDFFPTVFAKIEFVGVSTFVRTRDATKLSFLSRVVNKFFIAYHTFCDSMMMKIVACTGTVESIRSMTSSDRFRFVTKFTEGVQNMTPKSLSTILP